MGIFLGVSGKVTKNRELIHGYLGSVTSKWYVLVKGLVGGGCIKITTTIWIGGPLVQ